MTHRWGRGWLAVRDIVPVVVVAWVVFHLVRGNLLERYLIPSRSMEPVLHGDERSGDVVLVDKTAWWSSRRGRPEAFDLVVVRNRQHPGGNHLVKRFIAAGPARVQIEHGELRIGSTSVPVGPVLTKEPLAHPDLRQTAFEIERPASADSPELDHLQIAPEVWTVADREIVLRGATVDQLRAATSSPREADAARWAPGHLSSAGPMDSSFLDASGLRVPGGRVDVRDVGFELDLALVGDVEALHLVVELLQVCYAIEFARDGTVRIRRGAAWLGEPVVAAPLPIDHPLRISFGYLDGRLFVTVDDTVELCHAVDVPWSSPREVVLPGGAFRRPPANLLHVGLAGAGARARIRRVRGFHDVHYSSGVRDEYLLQWGEIFVLGDNSFDSSDSRDLPGTPFELADLIGAPIAILAPPKRLRWL